MREKSWNFHSKLATVREMAQTWTGFPLVAFFLSHYILQGFTVPIYFWVWLLYWKKKWNKKEWGINRTERIWLKKYRQFFSFHMVQHSKSFIARVTSSFSQALLVGNIVFLPRDTILFVLACRHCNQVYILQDCALQAFWTLFRFLPCPTNYLKIDNQDLILYIYVIPFGLNEVRNVGFSPSPLSLTVRKFSKQMSPLFFLPSPSYFVLHVNSHQATKALLW